MKSFINKQVIQLIMAGTLAHQSIDWRKRWNVSCSKYRFATSILRHIMSDCQVVLNVCVQEYKIPHMRMQCNKNLVLIIICMYLLVVLLTPGCLFHLPKELYQLRRYCLQDWRCSHVPSQDSSDSRMSIVCFALIKKKCDKLDWPQC